jgi:predicted nucleic acid-binding protein
VSSGPTATSLPRLWFLDTSSLLSMAVDEGIAAVVLEELSNDTVVLIDVVIEELEYRATISSTAALAKRALEARLQSWKTLETTDEYPVALAEVLVAQADVADGRALTDDYQHWAEATIIALGRQSAVAGAASIKVLFSEDYDARRVASQVPSMGALSIHKLLHVRVHSQRMSPKQAADLAEKLEQAGRGPNVTAEDFADPSGRLIGRVGKP